MVLFNRQTPRHQNFPSICGCNMSATRKTPDRMGESYADIVKSAKIRQY